MIAFHEAYRRGRLACIKYFSKCNDRLQSQLLMPLSERPKQVVGHQEICGVAVSNALRRDRVTRSIVLNAAGETFAAVVVPVTQFMRNRETLPATRAVRIDRDDGLVATSRNPTLAPVKRPVLNPRIYI